MRYEKTLKVGKVERYTYGLAAWANSEALTSATVTPSAEVTLSAADINGSTIGFYATGITAGLASIEIEYATATRSDCVIVQVKVEAGC